MKKLLVLIFPLLTLLGCDQRSQEQILLDDVQNYYHRNIDNNLYCFYMGDLHFPYTPIAASSEKKRFNIWVDNERQRRLTLFSQLGLLQKSDTADGTQYALTETGKSAFQYDKFCFGNIDVQEVTFKSTDNKYYQEATVHYKVTDIPEWARSDLFQNYFYRYNQENNGLQSYPQLDDSIKTAKLWFEFNGQMYKIGSTSSLRFSNSVTYDIQKPDDKTEVLSSVAFAYYDANLAKKLFSDAIKKDEMISYWGEPDPIVFEKQNVPEYIQRANTMILLAGEEFFLSPNNKIKSMKTFLRGTPSFDSQSTSGYLTLDFDENNHFKRYSFALSNQGASADTVKEKSIDPDDGTLGWALYTKTQLHYYAFQHKDSATIRYKLDDLGQIVAILSKQYPELNVTFTPKYDKEKRLIQYGEDKYIYQDDRLIERSTKDNKMRYFYDKKGQLSKIIDYVLKNDQYKKDSVCIFTEHNERGDWTAIQCDEIKKSYREITYYDN